MQQATQILAHEAHWPGAPGRERSLAFLAQLQEQQGRLGALSTTLDQVVERTAHLAVGLFPSEDVEGVPRTKHALEHCWGSARAQERRATARRGALPGMGGRGSVRLLAAVGPAQQVCPPEDLHPPESQRWRDLRAHVQEREETRRQQWRFRKPPAAYLAALEAPLLT